MKYIMVLISILTFTKSIGQNNFKGSSASKPWSESFNTFTCYHPGDTTLVHKSIAASASPLTVMHKFGQWKINYLYPHYYTITTLNQKKEDLKLIPILLGFPGSVKSVANYSLNIDLQGTTPTQNNFSGKISFNDSLFESYDAIFLGKRDKYFLHNFRKTVEGVVISSANDTAKIFISLDLSDRMKSIFSFQVSNDSISLIPKYSSSANERFQNGFCGVDLFYKNHLIAGVFTGKDIFGNIEYKYWLTNDALSAGIKEPVAAILSLIVKLL